MSTWLVQTLAVAAGLAVLAALAGLWSRTGPRTRHALWLLVLLKLMMPPLVIVNWPEAPPAPEVAMAPMPASWPPPTPTPEPASSPATALPAEAVAPPPAEPLPSPVPLPEPSPIAPELFLPEPATEAPPAPAPVVVPAFAPAPAAEPIDWMGWLAPSLLAAWLAGSLAIAARESYRLLRFQRQLARETRENIFEDIPEWLLLELADAARLLGVAAPRVTRTALVDTPLVWCLGRPRLLLPDVLIDNLSRDAWRGILRHELAHLKRRDHWVARLELLGEVAWWWNPVFWLARVQIHKYAELCCDAWVIALDSDTPGRHAYAMALLSVCEHLSKPRPTPTLGLALGMGVGETDVPGSRSARTLERRLRMILEEPPAHRTSRLALLFILLLGLVVIPIWLHERDRALIREIALLTTSLRPSPTTSLELLPPPDAQTTLLKPVPLQPELVTNAVLKGVEKPASLPLVEELAPSPLPPANEPPIAGEPLPLPLANVPSTEPPPAAPPVILPPNVPSTEPPPAAPPVIQQPDAPKVADDPSARARAAYDKATTLDLPEQSFRTTIRALSKETGLTFVLDPRSKEKLDRKVQFRGYGRSVEYALKSILEKLDLRATMDENGILLISDRPQPIPLKVQLPEVIEPTSPVAHSGLPNPSTPSQIEPFSQPLKRIQVLDGSPNTMELLVLRKPIAKTFQVKDQSLSEALKSLSKVVGYEIIPHQTIRDRADSTVVTYQSQGRSLAQELQSLISEYDCWYEVGKEGIIWVQGRTSREAPYSPSERQWPQVLRALAQPIDLNLNMVPLKQAVDEIQDKAGVSIVLDSRWSGIHEKKAYINASRVKLRTALKLLLRPLDLTFQVTDGVILISKLPSSITSEPPAPGQTLVKNPDAPTPDFPGVEMYRKLQTPIDLDIKDLPLDRIVRMIQAQTGVDIIINPNVKGVESKTATIKANGIKLASALDMVLNQHDLSFTADNQRITIAPGPVKPSLAASTGVPNPLSLPDPDAPASAPLPDPSPILRPEPASPVPGVTQKPAQPMPLPSPSVDPPATATPTPLPAPAEPDQPPPAAPPVRPTPASPPAAKPTRPTSPHPRSPYALDPGPERPTNRRSPFDLDIETPAPNGAAEDRPASPGRRTQLDLDSRTSQPKVDVESRELLQIQIRKAKAVLARVTAQKSIADSQLAKCLRLRSKDRNLVSLEEMGRAEAEVNVAESLIEVEKINVAEAEERLKEFDRRRARDLAKLKLSLSYARKARELAQTQHFQGLIPDSEFRKAKQAVEELELQLKYDFPEEKPMPETQSDERVPQLEPIDPPKST